MERAFFHALVSVFQLVSKAAPFIIGVAPVGEEAGAGSGIHTEHDAGVDTGMGMGDVIYAVEEFQAKG